MKIKIILRKSMVATGILCWCLAGSAAAQTEDDAPSPQAAKKAEELKGMLSQDGQPDETAMFELFNWLKNLVGKLSGRGAGTPVFDPQTLQQIADLGRGLPYDQRFDLIHQEFLRRYPGKIAKQLNWHFNSAGNCLAQLALLYGSTTEYVALFGTPIGCTGFSGRYNQADVWDLMIDGEMRTFLPGQFEPTVFKAGDSAYLKKGEGKGVVYVNHAWMIDYGRGNILSMFPFGVIVPAMFQTLDYQSAWEHFSDYAKLVLKQIFP